MAHKTLIGGTAYEIGGGKTLVNGTAYSIDKGKTLIGGTAYEVGFGSPMAKVRLMSDTFEDRDYTSAYISYTTPDGDSGDLNTAGEYELPIGTIIRCTVEFGGKSGATLIVNLNGEVVEWSNSYISYEYTLTQNVAIRPHNNYYAGGEIHIAEVPENAVVFILDSSHIYGAESGMTWEEWCNSDCYNANSRVTISGNAVLLWGSTLYYDGNAVKPTDTIIDGVQYY